MIAVVVPSYRPESLETFRDAWADLFHKHKVDLVVVRDGDDPAVLYGTGYHPLEYSLSLAPASWREVVFDHTDACRNYGFLWALKELWPTRLQDEYNVILTLDDDLTPHEGNDPIQEHLDALFVRDPRTNKLQRRRVPTSWFPVASEYTRGFPYGVRKESEVWLSHGVWEGVHDYDGPSQLVTDNKPMAFYKGAIPKGCLFPCSGMNLMWHVEATPFMYFAPMGKRLGFQRFADIWMGIRMKQAFDHLNKAVVTGYSTVHHDRASNVFNNLEDEARGIRVNEYWWQDINGARGDDLEYFKLYEDRRRKWEEIVGGLLSGK